MIRIEIDQIKRHFNGNSRVVFREGTYEGCPEVTIYVDGERVPSGGMIETGFPTGEQDIANIIREIDGTLVLALKRADMEAELRALVASIPLYALKTIIADAHERGPRHTDSERS